MTQRPSRSELAANRDVVFLHFPFWLSRSFVQEGLNETRRAVVLQAIRNAWRVLSPEAPLLDTRPLGGVGASVMSVGREVEEFAALGPLPDWDAEEGTMRAAQGHFSKGFIVR